MALILTSSAFDDGAAIPARFTDDGENVSPPLQWQGAPPGTKSFVLILEDPDAPSGVFAHWGIYNRTGSGLEADDGNPDAPDQARNGMGNVAYDGPAPPHAHGTHHYRFRLAALGIERLDFDQVPGVAELWAAAAPHRLAEAVLIGTYERP